MAHPAYFLTWTTYGTWLPGDSRGWVDKHQSGIRLPDSTKAAAAKKRMKETSVILEPPARKAVEAAIIETCLFREWRIHAINVRSNHVHIVVTASDASVDKTLRIVKAYGTRALNTLYPHLHRDRWWTDGGSTRYINDNASLSAAIQYVENQM
jgi:REP element-mobilizing transposase RayT